MQVVVVVVVVAVEGGLSLWNWASDGPLCRWLQTFRRNLPP
jgi:hypothetical protein